MGGFFFQYPEYPDALHELNHAMAAKWAETALALLHLQIFLGRFRAVLGEIQLQTVTGN